MIALALAIQSAANPRVGTQQASAFAIELLGDGSNAPRQSKRIDPR